MFLKAEHQNQNIATEGHSTFAPVMNFGMSPVPPCRIVFLIPSDPSNIVSFTSDIFFFFIYLLAFAATDPTVLTCMYILSVGLFGWHAACNIYKSLRRCCSCWIRLGEDNKIRNISPWYVSHGRVVWRSRNEEKLMNVPLSRLQHWGLGCGRRDD